MNLDNILRTMNEYLNDIFSTFGGASMEYSTAIKQVRDNLTDEVLQQVTRQGLDYKSDVPDKPIQFSRGKAAQQILSDFQGDLMQLRSEQRESGTAKVQAQRYYTEQKLEKPDTAVDFKEVQEQARQRYDFNSNVNDWYEEIDKAAELTEYEKEKIKEQYSSLNENYSDPEARKKLRDDAIDLILKAKQRKGESSAADVMTVPVAGVGVDLNTIT